MQKEITTNNENLNEFLRGIETKSIMTGSPINGESALTEKPWFFDPKSNIENFFFKHAKVLQTSLQSLNIVIPKDFQPSWNTPEEIPNLSSSKFNGKTNISSIVLKELFYSMILTNDIKKDIQINLEEYFVNHINKIMGDKILESFIYGDGIKSPIGILNESNKITFSKLENNNILEKMMSIYSEMREKNNININPIWIMSPKFHSLYLNNIVKLNNNINFSKDKFFNMDVYETYMLKKTHDCILIDLSSCYFIAYNPTIYLNHKANLFDNEIGIKSQIGTLCNDISKYAYGISLS